MRSALRVYSDGDTLLNLKVLNVLVERDFNCLVPRTALPSLRLGLLKLGLNIWKIQTITYECI